MKRLRAGAYVHGDYLIRYSAWLGEEWDGPRAKYCPWHVYRRASSISNRMRLDALRTLEEAKAYVARHIALDGKARP